VTRGGRLLAVNFAACLLLLVQYLLGMAVNLYVTLPGRHPGAGAANYFAGAGAGLAWVVPDGPAWAAAHAAFGLALVLAAFAAIALTRRQAGRADTALSVLGALAILGAGFNGVSFLDYGHDFSSMLMAGLWALALACYVTGMFRAARRLVLAVPSLLTKRFAPGRGNGHARRGNRLSARWPGAPRYGE
jgi:hypothetical protein